MSEKYKTYPNGTFFATMTVMGWMDVFTRSEYCEIIVSSLNYCIEKKGLGVYSYVLMSSHLHLIAQAEQPLGEILRDFKSFTAKRILQAIEKNPQESRKEWLLYMFQFYAQKFGDKQKNKFWQNGNHPIALDGRRGSFDQKMTYIHENPIKARMVDEAEHYPWCSAYPLNQVKLLEY
jgi:putative transposase